MKQKPEVKNELILDTSLFIEINGNDVHYPLRAVILWDDMLQLTPFDEDDRVKGLEVQILFSKDQVEQIFKLYQEWKDD